MKNSNKSHLRIFDSMILTGIGLAAFYWICESFMYFFLSPDMNFFQYLLGPDLFNTWTRLLVLCLFVIFGSHVQYTFNIQKITDKTLHESERKYREIIENIAEGFFETDLEGKITFFNKSVCNILGYGTAELTGMNNRDFSSPETSKRIYRIWNNVYKTGIPANHKVYELIRKDGSIASVEISTYLVRDQHEQPIGFRGVARDISVRLKAEQDRERLENQLRQSRKMEAIGNLAGGIAHDFNNILMGIQGNISLMLYKLDKENPYYNRLTTIERYIENGAAQTKQLLGFTRSGKYNVKATDMNELIRRVTRMFSRMKKEIKISTEYLKTTWFVEVDQSQIEQVLLNLFINSWHAMPEGGEISLMTEDFIITENLSGSYHLRPGRYIRMSVSDTGVGIDKDIQEKIFDPFFTTKKMGQGTGLGLSTASDIIKNHGGTIDISSEFGKGSTFYIYLPASERVLIEEVEMIPELQKGVETILFVDDEAMIMEVGQEILEALGYKVMMAKTGNEAIALFEKNKDEIDMIILDMVMPGMGAVEIYEKLKKTDPDVKVLLTSGYSIRGQAGDIMASGCDGFIQKPFKMRHLSVKIREVIDGE